MQNSRLILRYYVQATLKDVFQSNALNESAFDASRKSYINRITHVKYFTNLFQVKAPSTSVMLLTVEDYIFVIAVINR